HPAIRLASRLVGSVLLLGAFALPVYLFLHAEGPSLPPRMSPPVVTAGDVASIPVHSYRDAVPVLVYHDIANRPGRYTVSPRAFAEEIATLRKSGFHTISVAQLLAFLQGRGRLPERPVLITFDDGLGSAWRVADPI